MSIKLYFYYKKKTMFSLKKIRYSAAGDWRISHLVLKQIQKPKP